MSHTKHSSVKELSFLSTKEILKKLKGANEDYPLLLQLAKIYLNKNDDKEALYYLLRCELIKPCEEIYLALSFLFLRKSNFSRALGYFEKSFSVPSIDNPFFKKEDLKQEIRSLIEKLPLSQQESFFHQNDKEINTKNDSQKDNLEDLGFLYIQNNNFEKAVETLELAKEKSGLSSKYPVLNTLSLSAWEKEFPHLELQLQEKIEYLRYHAPTTLDFMDLGKMHFLKKDYERAKNYFTKARDSFLNKQS
jgi:uncharacterized protein HemY